MEQDKKTLASQLRAARALCGVSQAKLASIANVSSMTVKRAEGSGTPYPSDAAVRTIIDALESLGVIFIPENGAGVGVRMKKENHDGF